MTDSAPGADRLIAQDSEDVINAACPRNGRPADGLVVRITTAYEQGFGHALRTELSNPYTLGSHEAEAWERGREEGARRATPDQRLLESLRQALDFDGYGHWLPEICVRVAANTEDDTPPTFDEFVNALHKRIGELQR